MKDRTIFICIVVISLLGNIYFKFTFTNLQKLENQRYMKACLAYTSNISSYIKSLDDYLQEKDVSYENRTRISVQSKAIGIYSQQLYHYWAYHELYDYMSRDIKEVKFKQATKKLQDIAWQISFLNNQDTKELIKSQEHLLPTLKKVVELNAEELNKSIGNVKSHAAI